jgi:hypothetical protein
MAPAFKSDRFATFSSARAKKRDSGHASHPAKVPRIRMMVRYPIDRGAGVELASGGQITGMRTATTRGTSGSWSVSSRRASLSAAASRTEGYASRAGPVAQLVRAADS